jgi:hypothetical protein
MPEPFFVDTNRLTTALPGVGHIENSVRRVLTELVGVMDSAGPCWGGPDDATGRVFAAHYLPLSGALVAGLGDTRKALGSMHDGIVTMSGGFHATEVQATDTASHLLPPEPAPRPIHER